MNDRLLLAALKAACDCYERDTHPTDWNNRRRIPHHCDCPMYAVELPNAIDTPTAYADALARQKELLNGYRN